MNKQVTIEDMQKRKLFLGLPCYGGMCGANFTQSLMGLGQLFQEHKIGLQAYFLSNESLITRARSYIAEIFLHHTDCTHLMFIDSDISFRPQDVMNLLALQDSESPYDIIGAVYPKKTISWEKVKVAVDKGIADENPLLLEQYVADFVFNPLPGFEQIPLREPAPIMELGTGFMMIRRETFALFDKHFKNQYSFRPDHVRSQAFDGSKEIMLYFQAEIDPVTKRYWSEDYMFCQKVLEALKLEGKTPGKDSGIWMCPWMPLQHMGSYFFQGSLEQMARINVAATADPSMLKHKR